MDVQRRAIAASLLALVLTFGPASARAADPVVELRFSELYVDDFSIAFSDKLKSLAGKRVEVRGFMAPPLKADGNFIVLTRSPVEVCPFCAAVTDWPIDILAVYLLEDAVHVSAKVAVVGTLDIGAKTDAQLGFVSLIRLENATLLR